MLSPTDDPGALDGGPIAQLHALYADRERLHRALGTADADAIIALVRSLDAQLVDLRGTSADAPHSASGRALASTPAPEGGERTR